MESGLQELKFSRYNQKVELSGKLFLYNALTGGYASVDEEYRDNFDKCDFKKLDSMKELAELPNAIINQLMEGGFIIPKNFDEFNVIKSMHYRGRFGTNKALTMTLIPTMNCNFRCPYCYEKDKKYPVKKMTTEVMDAIIKYVESRIDSVDHIFVTWYGGEPLLGLHEIRIMQSVYRTSFEYGGCYPTAGGLHGRGRTALLRQVSHSERSLLPGKASRPVWA